MKLFSLSGSNHVLIIHASSGSKVKLSLPLTVNHFKYILGC